MKLERAVIRTEVRAAGGEGEGQRVIGLGVVYNKWEELWPGYRERILPGAVKFAPEVKSYFNHDPNQVLSTTESDPPLEIRETNEGIEYNSPIFPTSYGRDLAVNLERQNVKGSPFTFMVPPGGDKRWQDQDGGFHREISVLIRDEIGTVTDPAVVSTTASVRSAREAQIEDWRGVQREQQRSESDSKPELDEKDMAAVAGRVVRHGELKATL